jgi:cation:H+ antiporter
MLFVYETQENSNMLILITPYILIIAGLLLLIKGADFLVMGASSIARRFHISELVIGLTIVAFGTSTPEFFVNIIASLGGNSDIAIGNVLGSNIANFLLILGVSALICPLRVKHGTVWKEIPFSLLAVIVLTFTVNDRWIDNSPHSILSRSDGLIMLCFFFIFLYYSASIAKKFKGLEDVLPEKGYGLASSILMIIGGFVGLSVGGEWIVDSAVKIALHLGMSQALIGLTIVAIGTSLPELATSAVAAWHKNVEIAIGNVVGSNIFNIFYVLGLSSIIKPLPFNTAYNVDILVVILSSLLLFIFMFIGKKHTLECWQGALFLITYIVYLGFKIIFY